MGWAATPCSFFNSTETPTGHYQQVLLRIPKSLSLLQDQLQRVRPLLTDRALLLAGSMIKHLPPSAGDLLAAHIGPYQASLGWKRARLLQCRHDPTLQPRSRDLASHYPLEGTSLQLSNRPGVFSSRESWISAPGYCCPLLLPIWAAQMWLTWAAATAPSA
ncbi:hypothetical protein ULG90_11205 [Halopseudomonas pachastrellae]|nr:hypothetical protein ULG90_11205 [Halopseudomonas pachastrellae]